MSIEKAITGGVICIEDGKKAAEEFAPARKVKVELTFSVPEGENGKAYMEGVTRVCAAKVLEMLGKAPATAAAVTETPKAEEPKATKEKKPKAEKPPVVEKTKDDLAREAGLPVTAKADEPTITAAGKVVNEEDDLSELLGEAAPPPMSDQELGKAIQNKAAILRGEYTGTDKNDVNTKLRLFIYRDLPAGTVQRIASIPVSARSKLVRDLDALTLKDVMVLK